MATIAVADYVIHRRDPSWFAVGPFDHAAHLATAALLMPDEKSRAWNASFMAGSLLPDIDHVPLAFQNPETGDPRPRSHSLLSVGPAAMGSRAVAAGMLAHHARDLALEPGVPLLWPFRRGPIRIGYGAYILLIVVAALRR